MEDSMGEHEFGRYTGKLILEPLQGNRRMRTTQEFGFQDADGRHWRVPPGTSVDGTSIPPAMWSLVDGLWEGKYRAALVVHDYHCAIRSRDWQSVHRMLYEAIRVAGATERRAKLVYAGVYFAGPRWESRVGGPARSSRTVAPPQTASGNILYALCRDPVALAVSEAIECDGTSALNWITSAHRPTEANTEINLGLDKLSKMIEDDAPSLRSIEAAIDYAVALIPFVDDVTRRVSVRLSLPD
jgi:Protein of unknown function (DUF1353)